MKKSKRKPILFIGIVVGALGVIGLIIFLAARGSAAPVSYQYAAVTRGNIQTTIASTGTISARKTVDVGTQVSGQLAGVYADFNQHVRKGQVLARLDATLLNLAVQDATANELKAQAQYDLAQKDFENNTALHDKALIADYDYESSRVARDAAKASLLSAQNALSRARINLGYAVITSPIDGVVINRTVETGQTVAASLSAPTLFTIAEDLTSIQIETFVAESDIGSIKKGQKVTFTVTTYPDDTFTGSVDVVRLQPQTIQNVVNYVVMVNATNPGKKLMPGMTATVEFITAEHDNALLIPNAALQFKPPEDLLAAYVKERADQRRNANAALGKDGASVSPSPAGPAKDQTTDTTAGGRQRGNGSRQNGGARLTDDQRAALRQQFQQRRNAQGGDGSGNQGGGQLTDDQRAALRQQWQQRNGQGGGNVTPEDRAMNFLNSLPPNVKMLWTLDKNGTLNGIPVRTGLSDGQNTEIISDRVNEGMKFLSGKGTSGAVNRNTGNQRGGPGGFFFH